MPIRDWVEVLKEMARLAGLFGLLVAAMWAGERGWLSVAAVIAISAVAYGWLLFRSGARD